MLLSEDTRMNSCWGHKSKNYGYTAELVLFIISSRQFIFFGYVILYQEKKEILALRVTGKQLNFILLYCSFKNMNAMLKTKFGLLLILPYIFL